MLKFRTVLLGVAYVCAATTAWAQAAAPPPADLPQHQHMQMSGASGWMLMQDGVVFGIVNRQGGTRGDTEVVVPNWWMGMASRDMGRHRVTFISMLSLDPALVGRSGYHEIFQSGETLDGLPIVDRQHPHDFLMQLAATWRISIGPTTSLTIGGGPAAEPTLGPIAFMHRQSAAGLPFAPLGHHTFDSTHVSFGVVSAAIDRGRWTAEASVFNGREPDDQRWDLDLGRMDSVAARVWFRPAPAWSLQVSSGRLRDPEAAEPGVDVQRTTASASWTRTGQNGFTAVTAGWGMNDTPDARRQAFFAEGTTERGSNSVFGRLEIQQVDVATLIGGGDGLAANVDPHHPTSTVGALTAGAARRVVTWRGFEGALAAQATLYDVPAVLRSAYGTFPVSAQVFFRLRLPSGPMGRMWNHRMLGAQ